MTCLQGLGHKEIGGVLVLTGIYVSRNMTSLARTSWLRNGCDVTVFLCWACAGVPALRESWAAMHSGAGSTRKLGRTRYWLLQARHCSITPKTYPYLGP